MSDLSMGDPKLNKVIEILQQTQESRLSQLEGFRDKVDDILSDYEDLGAYDWDDKYEDRTLAEVLRMSLKGL